MDGKIFFVKEFGGPSSFKASLLPFLCYGSLVIGDYSYIDKEDWIWFNSFNKKSVNKNKDNIKKITRFELMEI